jgi:hypothetical protein
MTFEQWVEVLKAKGIIPAAETPVKSVAKTKPAVQAQGNRK